MWNKIKDFFRKLRGWKKIRVCSETRVLPVTDCPSTLEQWFRSVNIPTINCSHEKVSICFESGLNSVAACPNPQIKTLLGFQKPTELCTHSVEVVCSETGDQPNGKWCPKEQRVVLHVPTKVCTVHHEPIVTKKVCKETGGLVNSYWCLDYEYKDFPESQAPTAVCYKHQKIENHDQCKIQLGLMGALSDTRFVRKENGSWMFDEKAYREFLQAVTPGGINTIRVFAQSPWGDRSEGRKSQFSPFILGEDNQWILGSYNDYYFPILTRFAEITNACGVELEYDYLDHCEVIRGDWNEFSPWLKNIQGIEGFYDPRSYGFVKDFMFKACDALAGLRVVHSFGNEMMDQAAVNLFGATFVPLIRDKNISFDRLNFGGTMTKCPWNPVTKNYEGPQVQDEIRGGPFEHAFGEAAKFKVTRNVHGCGVFFELGSEEHQALFWWARRKPAFNIGPVVASDDGSFGGSSECDWVEYKGQIQRRPSAHQLYMMTKRILDSADNFYIEHCLKNMFNISCILDSFRSISRAYFEKFGAWPQNYRQG